MRLEIPALLVASLVFAACTIESGPRDLDALPGAAGTNAAPQTDETPGPHGGPILAIGDSLLVGAAEHGGLSVALEFDGWLSETIAENGRPVGWAIDQVELRTRVPRYVVVVLGSNPGFSSDGFADDIKALRDILVRRGARRILWIPPHHTDPERYAEKLRMLREADRADRRLVVPDWGRLLDEHPQWITGDGIHLTEDGYFALSLFIREQLARLG